MNYFTILFGVISILQTVTVITADRESCFEVLNKYSAEKIKKIFDQNLRDTILKETASEIFDCYLTKSSPGDKSLTKQLFDIYKKLGESSKPLDNAKLEEIVSMGLPIKLENQLKNKLKQGGKITVSDVQNMIGNEIELSGEFTTYRKHIEKELNEQEAHDNINIISWIIG